MKEEILCAMGVGLSLGIVGTAVLWLTSLLWPLLGHHP